MQLKIGKQILPLKQCYELILNYANRDDELVSNSFLYQNENNVKEISEILNQCINVDYMNGEKFYGDVPNFLKYFQFQNIRGKFSDEQMQQIEDIDEFCDNHWFDEKISGMDNKYELLENMYYEKYPERQGNEPILWDYYTCSGEIPLEIWSWELYYYDEKGNKYEVEVE